MIVNQVLVLHCYTVCSAGTSKFVFSHCQAVDGNLKPKTSINSTGAHLKSVRELMKQKRRELSAGSAAVNHEDETGVDGLAASSPVEPETVYAGGDETVLVIEQELAVTQIEIRSESVLA